MRASIVLAFTVLAAATMCDATADELSRSEPLLDQNPRSGAEIQIGVEYPADGAVISDYVCGAFVAGHAHAAEGELPRIDVAVVLDVSRSTLYPSGADINANGIVAIATRRRAGSAFEPGSTDRGDSILAAEVLAARHLINGFDPRTTRVALIAFSGDARGVGSGRPSTKRRPAARVLHSLTHDFGQVIAALDELEAEDPTGSTDMAAGVDAATEALAAPGASAGEDRERLVFFFTDGQPTLPHGPGYAAENIREVLRAAERAAGSRIRVHSFGIGREALAGPLAAVELARRTGGSFVPVRHPGDLTHAVRDIKAVNLSGLQIRNNTNGRSADPLRMAADGTWGCFIALEEGENEIEITARAADGASATKTLWLSYRASAAPYAIPTDLQTRRNWLLRECLSRIKTLNVELEESRDARVGERLRAEIQMEREKARQRAAEQSKRLEIAVEGEGADRF